MIDLTRTAHSVLTRFNLTHMPFYGRYEGVNLIRFAAISYDILIGLYLIIPVGLHIELLRLINNFRI